MVVHFGHMKFSIVYLKVHPASERLYKAQEQLEESIAHFSLDPLPYPAGRKLVPIGHLLSKARESTTGRAFVWCNSDVTLTRNPFEVPNPNQVYGFHRREIPSGEICLGVDMFYIPISIWDTILSKDIPQLFLGASYVDWWIPRLMESLGTYENLTGYLDHLSHPLSSASANESNHYYQCNFNAYNRWAKRHALSTIPRPPVIPWLGHIWGVRDVVGKMKRRLWKK